MISTNCHNIWPLFLPTTLFLLLLGRWVSTLLSFILSENKSWSVIRWFYKNTCSFGIVFVKHRSLCGLTFPSALPTAISPPWKLIRNLCRPPMLQLHQPSGAMDWQRWQGREISEYLGHGEKWKRQPLTSDLMLKARPCRSPVGHKHIMESQHQRRSLWDHGPVR